MVKINYYEISRIPTVDARKVLATIEDDEKHPERKRRRLDNLNIEERVLRRKLKNRVAAQTARDRKKAYMDSLDHNLGRVERENKFLKQSNEELRSQVHQLLKSNSQLRARLGLTPPASPTQDYTCLTALKKDKYEIITPSVCDHDHIVIKKEERANNAVEYNPPPSSCFRNPNEQTELLLDVIGDNEPIELTKSEFTYAFQNFQNIQSSSNTRASETVEEIDRSSMPPNQPLPQNTSSLSQNTSSVLIYKQKTIKLEELDVDDLLSDNNDNNNSDVLCPTSPDSQPSSPSSLSSSSSIDVVGDGINIKDLCDESELSLVESGYRIVDELGCDDEFMSCSSGDMQDPFADLFPSLI